MIEKQQPQWTGEMYSCRWLKAPTRHQGKLDCAVTLWAKLYFFLFFIADIILNLWSSSWSGTQTNPNLRSSDMVWMVVPKSRLVRWLGLFYSMHDFLPILSNFLVSMPPTCGTSFLTSQALVKISALLNQGWKRYCLL